MRLVDRYCGDLDVGERSTEAAGPEPLRRDVQQLVGPVGCPSQDFGLLRLRLRRAQLCHAGQSTLAQALDLVAHQRDEGRHHQRQSRPEHGRHLVGQRFPGAGRHHGERVVPCEEAPHDIQLARPPPVEAQQAPRLLESGLDFRRVGRVALFVTKDCDLSPRIRRRKRTEGVLDVFVVAQDEMLGDQPVGRVGGLWPLDERRPGKHVEEGAREPPTCMWGPVGVAEGS